MINPIDKNEADSICTAILLGYCIKNKNTTFQYHETKDRDDYVIVKDLFKEKCNVEIDVSLSQSKDAFPLIVAKCNAAPTINQAKAISDTKFTTLIEKSINETIPATNKYRGAYLGGFSVISSINLVGVSDLVLYDAKYRMPLVAEDNYTKSYNDAVSVSTVINSAINDFNKKRTGTQIIDAITINLPNSGSGTALKTNFAKYISGKLFKSYHGMILAMTKFATDIEANKNGYFFEVALGKDTDKVSSCFPCCTFMKAQGKPPTSIHLGRGDNWNIPDNALQLQRNNWENNIKAWFNAGRSKLSNASIQEHNIDDIPNIFLEALTFEGSFINKIKHSLTN